MTTSVQFDEYLANNGVNWALRKIILASKLTHDIEHKGDSFKCTITNPKFSYTVSSALLLLFSSRVRVLQTTYTIGGGEFEAKQGPERVVKGTAKVRFAFLLF